MCRPTTVAPDSAASKAFPSKSQPSQALTFVIPVAIACLASIYFPDAIDASQALTLWRQSHLVNAWCCFLSSTVLVMDPPKFLRGSQATRYCQLGGFGFLTIGLQSYHCAKYSLTEQVLTSDAIALTVGIMLYCMSFATLTWPMRIPENSPKMNGAEKLFSVLAVATSIGMVPALFLK